MFTIIRSRELAVLREEAAQLAGLRSQVTEARHAAEAGAAEAARLGGELDAAIAAAGGRLGRLLRAARDPVTGSSVQADIALHVVRDMIAEVKASGDTAAIEGIRVMDALLGEDSPFPLPAPGPQRHFPRLAAGRARLPAMTRRSCTDEHCQ